MLGKYAFCVIPLLLLSTGCGPATGRVSGSVSLEGNPLGSGLIYFVPDPSNQLAREAVGELDGQGRFILKLAGGSYDIPVGEYRVAVIQAALDESSASVQALPSKYQDISTSDLHSTVKAGTNDILIPLAADRPKK